MTSPVRRVGDLADATVAAVRLTPARVGRAWAGRRHRRLGLLTGVVVLLLYLLAIGDVTVAPHATGRPAVTVPADWLAKLTATRAPYLFEPVAAVRVPWLVVFVSPANLLLGGLLATLLAVNVAVASHLVHTRPSCRATAFGRLVAVLPAFGVGLACCAPTLLLVVGTGFAAALAPVVLPLRSWLFPLSVALLLANLLWTVTRPASPPARPTGPPGAPVRRTRG
ncbi:MAG: hypothetical protein GEV07_17545 [Streptosporangiales bacterium]|nr:hypothetical protein [Streptosporangiales bacterium]